MSYTWPGDMDPGGHLLGAAPRMAVHVACMRQGCLVGVQVLQVEGRRWGQLVNHPRPIEAAAPLRAVDIAQGVPELDGSVVLAREGRTI